MIAIRKLGWSALVLAAFVGCGKEPETTTTPPSTSTSTETTPATTTTPATETAPPATTTPAPEAGKGTTAPDMPKIEAPQPTPATKDEAKPEEAKPEEKKPEEKAAAVSLSPEEVAEIKKLPGGEADQALKQLLCPVSGENLGSMGMPIKVSAEGQTFYLCCKGCSKDVKDDPAAVVAMLKK